MIEFLWAWTDGIILQFLVVISLVGTVTFIGMCFWEKDQEGYQERNSHKADSSELASAKMGKTLFKPAPILFILFSIIISIPSPNKLFKYRLGILKFQLASPENIKRSSVEIQRIAEKLECKYLGCEEKKEAKQ